MKRAVLPWGRYSPPNQDTPVASDPVPPSPARHSKRPDSACRNPREVVAGARALLSACGYRPDDAFNRLEGTRRLLFHDDANSRHVDVFVRDFAMCHTIAIGERLLLEPVTLPLAGLLLTKLQIVELNVKDRQDIYALLQTHPVGAGDGGTVNGARVATGACIGP